MKDKTLPDIKQMVGNRSADENTGAINEKSFDKQSQKRNYKVRVIDKTY